MAATVIDMLNAKESLDVARAAVRKALKHLKLVLEDPRLANSLEDHEHMNLTDAKTRLERDLGLIKETIASVNARANAKFKETKRS